MQIKLTEAEISHLLSLLYARKEEGSYYGNQAHYYKRTDNLIRKLEEVS